MPIHLSIGFGPVIVQIPFVSRIDNWGWHISTSTSTVGSYRPAGTSGNGAEDLASLIAHASKLY